VSEALVPVDRLSLPALRLRIAELLHPDADPSVAAEVYMGVLAAERMVKEVRSLFDEQLLAWLAEHGNELTVADTKLYAGVTKSEKVRDLKTAAESALDALGGDWYAFASLLSANALKAGECEVVLGPEWRREHFEVSYKTKVEVKTVNQKFLKGKAKAVANG